MNTLNEERIEMEKELARRRDSMNRLDEFFARLDKNPLSFSKVCDERGDVYRHELELEKARCIRKVTVLKSRLEQLYDEFSRFNLELMENPLYTDIQEGILTDMGHAISGFYELLERYEEEISVLEYDILNRERDYV